MIWGHLWCDVSTLCQAASSLIVNQEINKCSCLPDLWSMLLLLRVIVHVLKARWFDYNTNLISFPQCYLIKNPFDPIRRGGGGRGHRFLRKSLHPPLSLCCECLSICCQLKSTTLVSSHSIDLPHFVHRTKCEESADWNFAETRDNVAET